VVRGCCRESVPRADGTRTVVPSQPALHLVEVLVQVRVGQVEARKDLSTVGGHEHETAGTAVGLVLQQRLGECFRHEGLARVADEERSPTEVVSDHGLLVAGLREDRHQRERNAPVEQREGGRPGDAELPRRPAVL
jgi:hypothetical protein